MENYDFNVKEKIQEAQTISKDVYSNPKVFNLIKKKVFENHWQLITDLDHVKIPGQYLISSFLDSLIEEPILLTRDLNDKIHCLSNVCTHRGNILVEFSGHTTKHLRCRYHGRRFELDGSFHSMPEMDKALNFPCESDNLIKIPFKQWKKFIFASLNPLVKFSDYIKPIDERIEFLPLDEFIFDSERSQDYVLKANWVLYVENYLEGFHIPYVHPGLANELDLGNYMIELYEFSSLQVGIATGGKILFDLPKDHQDFGQNVAAYYFWLFPNLMMNFYPWGLSINIIKPLAINKTRISYLTYVWKEDLIHLGAGA
ncbi:MAG: aromatic ring-hydroxylating dioxygenase subunit alpha, partial [Candidatus Heimdallarchaeota archaeon]